MAGRRVSPYLLARIPVVVASAPGGGLSRGELAERLRVREFDKMFAVSLLAVYRRGEVDFCGGYVVVPPPSSRPLQVYGTSQRARGPDQIMTSQEPRRLAGDKV